jgi:sulfur-carrier protein adenylyltransferase/sulfurtransferase
MWWLRDPARLKAEIKEIEDLKGRVSWLPFVRERVLPGLKIAVDFDLSVNDETLPFMLEYPAFFPETPPLVTPRDKRHYSKHQYANGELCLEYRADNWDPSVTGAMMIESAHRLLTGEQPAPDLRAIVPDAHHMSLGQQLRSNFLKFMVTRGFRDYVAGIAVGSATACHLAETPIGRRSVTCHVACIGLVATPLWREDTIPAGSGKLEDGQIIRVNAVADIVVSDHNGLLELIGSCALHNGTSANDKKTSYFTVFADAQNAKAFFSYFHDEIWKILEYATIDLTNEPDGRLPEGYKVLSAKKVGLVGGGSLGSKIAASLARSGVGAFVIVDDDIVKPGNLMRHELDVASLGAHKVDALEARLLAVGPNVKIDAYRTALGGHESSGSTAVILDELAKCDLLIDATADPQAFNFVASVARSAKRMMIWAEVYAGGVGGFVARLRPDFDPPPHHARRQYIKWCEINGVPWLAAGGNYDAQREDNPPLVASDADVAVIAAHVTRMAIDALVNPDASEFPHPAYAIGLTKGWIFEEPFDVRPIDFTAEGKWQLEVSSEEATDALEYMARLIEQDENADRTGT